MRDSAAKRLSIGLNEDDVSVRFVRALLLGDRTDLDEETRDAFASTGLLHVLAVSGLHVGILVVILVMLLQSIGVTRRHAPWLIMPVLMVYAVVVGLRASVLRATIMSGMLLGAMLLKRRPDTLAALAVSAVGILAACPGQWTDSGFILSFAAILGLVLVGPKLMPRGVAESGMEEEEWSVEPLSPSARTRRAVLRHVIGLVIASCAVWMATAPLIARWFHVLSPAALVGNLLVIPMAFAILTAGLLSLLFGWVHASIAEIFNFANFALVRLLLLWVHALSRIPGAFWRIGEWPPTATVIWYLLLFFFLTARGFLRRAVYAVAVLALGVGMVRAGISASRARLVIVEPIESGAVLFDGPWGRRVLVHAGAEFLASRVVRCLRDRGVSSVDAVILAEPDAEHAGGLSHLLDNVPVGEVWCSPFVGSSPVTVRALRKAQEKGVRIRRLVAGDIVKVGPIEYEVFHPTAGAETRRRAEPLILRAQWGRSAVLLAGAVTPEIEQAVLNGRADPNAEILLLGGRNMRAACSPAWLDAVRPAVVLMAVGAEGQWVEPSFLLIEQLKARGIEFLRTDREGPVIMEWLPRARGAAGFVRRRLPRSAELF